MLRVLSYLLSDLYACAHVFSTRSAVRLWKYYLCVVWKQKDIKALRLPATLVTVRRAWQTLPRTWQWKQFRIMPKQTARDSLAQARLDTLHRYNVFLQAVCQTLTMFLKQTSQSFAYFAQLRIHMHCCSFASDKKIAHGHVKEGKDFLSEWRKCKQNAINCQLWFLKRNGNETAPNVMKLYKRVEAKQTWWNHTLFIKY